LTLIFATSTGFAATIETLLMPGPVHHTHAEVEETCKSCHEPFSRSLQNRLCLDCHESVAADINTAEGFHGRIRNLERLTCAGCHTEHEGRDADIIGFNPEAFDHERTDFILDGAHAAAPCQSCHVAETPYREAPGRCVDCHGERDPHRGELGEDCASCHVTAGWRQVEFDHGTTDFPLVGKHVDVDCKSCHVNLRYAETATLCVACHGFDDVHGGDHGKECQTCHSPSGWDQPRFDHARETEFPLLGKHSGLSCNACHTGPIKEQELEPACVACHRSDDRHAGRNGTDCGKCHNADAWIETSFDHGRDTDFPLQNRHAELECEACHRARAEDETLAMACYTCHRLDDAHQGRLGEACETCHADSGWQDTRNFEHDLTAFPLIGQHAVVPCESCHVTAAFHETEGDCLACHAADDVHAGSLGEQCSRCHNPNDWRLWVFDHGQDTDFALEGAHADLACSACHQSPGNMAASRSCGACHRTDDPHLGRFGRSCDRCHTTASFKELRSLP
jgi:hypothetical protein